MKNISRGDNFMKIGVIGGGSWGTALARVLGNKGYDVVMYLRDSSQVLDIEEHRENRKYLKGVDLPKNLRVTNNIEEAIGASKYLLLSSPTHSIREILLANVGLIDEGQIVINVAKGIENNTLERISEIVGEILPNNKYVMLSGPSHAEEVGLDMPTTVVSACKDLEVAEMVQDLFSTPYFRVYTNTDVVGVELGGALKNVIALGAGISDGLGYGDNTKAALMTRGIIEISRLGEKLGANPSTFSGLAGIGDLIVTCTSMHSRNRRAGILIGEGQNLDETIKSIGMVVEGVKTTKSTYELSKKYQVEMPITEEIYKVLYEGHDVKNSVMNLMIRDKKSELEYTKL